MMFPKEVSLPSIYDTIDQTMFWLTFIAAIVVGPGIYSLIMDWCYPNDDDPDGWT